MTEDDFKEAWQSIMRTPAGAVAYLHLQKIVMTVVTQTDPGTLQRDAGRRSLAAELRSLMTSDTAESKSGGTDATTDTARPVVFAARGASGVRRPNYREYAAAYDPELKSTS